MQILLASTDEPHTVYFVPDSFQDSIITRFDSNLELRHNNCAETLKLDSGCEETQSFRVEYGFGNTKEIYIVSQETERGATGECTIKL